MGTIATKLEYLNTTKEKIRDSINLTGANIGTSDTFRSYASKLKKGYIDIINNGIDTLYNNFPKVSGIGSNLSLTPTYEAPMKLNEIQGNTLQNGTPTPDSPVEIQSVTGLQKIEVCGKNLCFNITKPSNANLRFFINKSISKTFTISFTTNEALNGNSLYLEVDGTSYGNIGGITASANTKVEKTYTLSDANYQAIQDGTNIDLLLYKNGANFNIPDDGMVENNSTATTYEPYNGNTYEVNLGKNIWSVGNKNVGWATNYVDVKNILNTLSEGTYSIKLNFKVTEIVKERTDNQYGFSFYNSNGNIGNKKNTNSNINVDDIFICVYTFTISKSQVGNFTQAYFYGFGNGTDNVTARSLMYDCQLEKGSQATSYSPYFTPIELNKIGTYQDYIYKSNGDWYIHKEIEKTVLNGSEDWLTNTSNGRTFMLNMTYPNRVGKSNRFNYSNEVSLESKNVFYFGNQQINFVNPKVNNTLINTLEDWKLYLKEQYDNSIPVLVYHILATPTDTQITNTELIEDLETLYTAKSQEGTTNISITSEDLEMILNVSALKGEV